MRKLLVFVLAYFIITMAWAYPWHMIWFHDLYLSWGAFTRSAPVMELGVAAILIQGLVIGYLYPRSNVRRAVGSSIVDGIKFNLVIGLMTYTAMGFAMAAKIEIEPVDDFLLYHTIFQFIQFTLTGTALGWIYRHQLNSGH